MTDAATTYHLVRPSVAVEVPTLDEQQQRVVDHRDGPLLVLAGPGTGKIGRASCRERVLTDV